MVTMLWGMTRNATGRSRNVSAPAMTVTRNAATGSSMRTPGSSPAGDHERDGVHHRDGQPRAGPGGAGRSGQLSAVSYSSAQTRSMRSSADPVTRRRWTGGRWAGSITVRVRAAPVTARRGRRHPSSAPGRTANGRQTRPVDPHQGPMGTSGGDVGPASFGQRNLLPPPPPATGTPHRTPGPAREERPVDPGRRAVRLSRAVARRASAADRPEQPIEHAPGPRRASSRWCTAPDRAPA